MWALIGLPIVIVAVAVAATPGMTATAAVITLLVGILVTALFALARLETEVRTDGVVIRFHGLWPTRRIRLDEIVDVEARRYSMWESGGWGVHFTFAGMTYNVSGNEGVAIRLRTGRRVLVGSQRAGELSSAIREAMRRQAPR